MLTRLTALALCLAAAAPALCASRDAEHGCVTVMAAGDIMLDRGVCRRAFIEDDPNYPLAEFKTIFAGADLVIGNLECSLTTRTTSYPKQYTFHADPAYAARLAQAGVDVLSLANNHAYDFGRKALAETAELLKKAGIVVVGFGHNLEQASSPRLIEKNGLRIALLAFVTIPLEGIMFLGDRPTPAIATEETVAQALAFARQRADFVIVIIHWGTEYSLSPDAYQLRWATFFREHGADLVIGHHPHVIQPVEQVAGSWVFFSLGNFVFDQPRSPRNLALAARVRFCADGIEQVSAVPIEIVDTRPVIAGHAAAADILQILRDHSEDIDFRPGPGRIDIQPAVRPALGE